MSNSLNPNGNNGHSNTQGARGGTRVVLREITATLQNSPPMQPGLRKVATNTQTGKTEHEVKVQFTREFVDAGAPNSRPESLSSAGSFQSLASTPSTKSSPVPCTTPVTPLRATDTSYVDSNIPGLEDLIAACGSIQLEDKIDAEESEAYKTVVDTTLTIATTDDTFQSQDTIQNSFRGGDEEAFTSAINDSAQLNGTQDLSSDYKEAHETSNSLNDTKEFAPDPKLEECDFGPRKNFSCEEKVDDLTTNRIEHSSDIPQSLVDNSAPEEAKDSSLKSSVSDAVNFNLTTDIAPISGQPDTDSLEVQDYSLNSSSSKIPQQLNKTNDSIANCNSTFDNIESSKSGVANITCDVSSVDNDRSIDLGSQSTAHATVNPSNELSAAEEDKDILTLNNPPNSPPGLDVPNVNENISTSSLKSLDIPNGFEAEIFLTVEEPPKTKKESDSFIETHVPEAVKDSAKDEETTLQTSHDTSEGCVVDSSTVHLTDLKSQSTNQTEIPISSTTFKDKSQNISAESLRETIVQEVVQQLSNSHDAPIVVFEAGSKVVENLHSDPIRSQDLQEIVQPVLQEIPNTKNLLEFEHSKELPAESSTAELNINKGGKNPEADLSANQIIVPYDSQDSLRCLQEFEESKSKKLPQVAINVTPFPGSNLEIEREPTPNPTDGSQSEGSSIEQDSNQTVIIQEESFHSVGSDGASENYQAFLPQQQSTSLQSDCNFKKLEQAAQVIAEEIRNKSFELTEDSDQFFNADSELFADPASFDFFLSKNNSKNTIIRDLRAESLYVKFDPLVSNANMLPQGPPQVVDGEENTKASIPQPTLDTPKRNPAVAAIDRLLIYSPAAGTPHKFEAPPKIEEKIVEEVKPELVPIIDETMAKELELVRSTVLQLESELEKERKEHKEELEKQRLSYKKLEEELAQEVQKKNEMTLVMDEYEKSLSRQMTDRERERASFAQERARLQEELQTANHHLGNTEAAFNDVHSKYERMKSVVSAYKSNEEVLKESCQENVETIKTLEARYDQLKNHAMSQLEKANLELESIRKQHETETVRLQAMIRKAELKSNSLAEMVEQKSKENKELAAILDEVIARVGQNPE